MANGFFRFLRFYNHILHKHKYPVQIATGGLLWFTGDLLAQGAVHTSKYVSRHDDDDDQGNDTVTTFNVDWSRTAKMTTYGVCISAPAFAFWYSFLDKASHRIFNVKPGSASMVHFPSWFTNSLTRPFLRRLPQDHPLNGTIPSIPAQTVRTWKIIGFKLAADGLVFDPLYLSLFFSATGYMEGKGRAEITEKLQADLFTTYLVDVFVWSPIQTLNFRYVPVVYQALVVQSFNIVWNAYLSYVQHRNDLK
jgi:hypothetical protein